MVSDIQNNHHVVIAAMPLVDSMHAPMMAPAVLKASLNRAGFKATAIDLNIEVLLKVKSHPDYQHLLKFFEKQHAEDWVVEQLSGILFYCAKRIQEQKPSLIALSLLTYECQNFTLWLCLLLKQLLPDTPIVIGGPGIKHQVANFNDHFRDTAKQLGLVDDWISGDGDVTLVEYVKGNKDHPGINNDLWQAIDDLDSLPYPDWSDYNFYNYSQTYMPILDAKGCVRNCEFCDVIEYWQKFRSRAAECIFEEMLHQYHTYGMTNFDFRSSISNGNLKEFKKLVRIISDYNKDKMRPEQFAFNSSFIIRPASQHPPELWEQMAACHATLALGVESVVPHVRKDLGKYFENPDIDYHLEMAEKYGVHVDLLIITGYPTETREDWQFTYQWFRDRQNYNKTIKKLQLSPATILPGTGLDRNAAEYDIIKTTSGADPRWYTNEISYEERMEHHDFLCTMVQEIGFDIDMHV